MNPLAYLRSLGAGLAAGLSLGAVAEDATDAILCADGEGRVTFLNPSARRLLGCAWEATASLSWRGLFPEAADLRAAAGTTFETVARGLDGSRPLVEVSVSSLPGGRGSWVVFRDTHARREALAALRSSEAGFRALAETAAAAVLIYQDDRIRWVNDAASMLTGYARDELMGMNYWDLIDPDFRSLLRQQQAARREGLPAPTRSELKIVGKRGQTVWIDTSGAAIEYEGRPASIAIAFDITDRRLAEDAMRESERRMRDLIENVQLISVVLDTTGEVTFANEYLLELAGYDQEEVIGRNWFDLFLPEARREALKRSFQEGVATGAIPQHEEYDILTARGDLRWVSWSHTALHDPRGAITGTASIGADITERRKAEERLLHDALHDSLTGLPNRTLFMDRLAGAVGRLRRRPEQIFAVVFMDLDRFKVINDSLGHVAGDQFLVQVGHVLSATIRRADHTLARLGGDEFAILLDDIQQRADAEKVVERIFAALAKPIRVGAQELFASMSVGIAFSSPDYERAEDLLRDADTAMYHAKTTGRARVQVFDPAMHTSVMRLLRLENSLRRAVDRDEFIIHYQPIVSLKTGRVTGFEALVRWEHPERGLIPPAEFVQLAEETGLIYAIGRFTFLDACRRLQEWDSEAPPDLSISVNLSGRQFSQADLADQIESVLKETGASPGRIKLEITESVIMESPEVALAMLRRLKDLGVRVCIDDFGTGYSSLSYLLRLPADTLKIDRSFVWALGKGGRNDPIVGAIVSLASSLEMDVVAEGIETAEQATRCRDLGCAYGQGYFFSKPVDAERARTLLSYQATL